MNPVKRNLDTIHGAMSDVGVAPSSVTIVGVIKRQPVSLIEQGIAAGLSTLGCNYVQEALSLRNVFARSPVAWHFIGHIQSRKAKNLIHYDCIQSLDRLSVAESLGRLLEAEGRRLPVLIQINIGEEEKKSGIREAELPAFLKALSRFPPLEPVGLMALPPPLQPVTVRRPFFSRMKKLYDSYQRLYPFRWLSMGTSEDYLIAVQEGANMIRLGTTLFGPRPSLIGRF